MIIDNGRCLPTLSLSCRNISRCRAWPSCITFGLHKMENWREMWPSHIAFCLHTMVCRHRKCTARIAFCMHTMVKWRRMWVEHLLCDLHTLVIQSNTWPFNIVHSLHSSVYRQRTWPSIIFHSLRTSFCRCWPMTCTSPRAPSQPLWSLYIGWGTFELTNVREHQKRNVHLGKVTLAKNR